MTSAGSVSSSSAISMPERYCGSSSPPSPAGMGRSHSFIAANQAAAGRSRCAMSLPPQSVCPGHRVAQPEHEVVDLHDRVVVGGVTEAAPARGIVQALRPRAAGRAVAPRIVEPRTIELEEALRHAAVQLGVVPRRDDGVGDAAADHVGSPRPVGIVAEGLEQVRARRGLQAVEDLDGEGVLAFPVAVLDDAAAGGGVGGREGDPFAVDHHPAEPRRQVAELEHQHVGGVVRTEAAGIDQVAGGGIAAEDHRRRPHPRRSRRWCARRGSRASAAAAASG